MTQRRLLWVVAAATVIYFFAYWRRLFLDQWLPFDGDMLRLVYPSWVIGKELLRSGSLLWDPFRNMGQPFLASPPNQALYPLQWISPFVSFLRYNQVFIALHTAVLFYYTHRIARFFGHDHFTSWATGFMMAFNGAMISKPTLHIDLATMAWAPAAVYYMLAERPKMLAAILAIQCTAGFPTYWVMTGVLLIGIALANERSIQQLRCLAIGGVLAAGLAAVLLLPFLEMLRDSVRGVVVPDAGRYSLHPIELLRGVLMPGFLEAQMNPVTDTDPSVRGFFFGPFVLTLFLWGVYRGGRRERLVGALGVLFIVLAFGKYIPFMPTFGAFRFPALWMFPAIVCVVLIAGHGLGENASLTKRMLFISLIATDFLFYARPYRVPWGEARVITQDQIHVPGLETVPDGTRLFHVAMIADRVHLWSMDSLYDSVIIKGAAVPSIATAFGIREVASRTQLGSADNARLVRRLNASAPEDPLFAEARISKVVTLLDRARTKRTPDWADFCVVENTHLKPRAFFANDGRADVTTDRPGRIDVNASGDGGVLVVSESFNSGWRARIDGIAASPVRFDDFFLSVRVPSGNHRVKFVYCPWSFLTGLALTLLTMLGLAISEWRAWKRIPG